MVKQKQKQSGLAVAALVLGILGFIFGIIPAILAIIFGAMRKDEKFGKVGMILGIIALILSLVIMIVLAIFLQAAFSSMMLGGLVA